jgi:surface antigen
VLAHSRTGIVLRSAYRNDRDDNWRRRYSRSYSYNDDLYYRECRNRPDPSGMLLGGLIGGLLGRAANDDGSGGMFAGIIIGSALGAAVTRDMDCDDRGYAYHAYFDSLNSGRAGRAYRWHNPSNNHRGDFRVRSYSYDADGFQCASYVHTAFLDRRRQETGRACRQPDGAWAFLN